MIRNATSDDAAVIAAIYNPYVLTTAISFEERPVGPAEMAKRISEVQENSLPWLVLEKDGAVLGFAYATKWRTRHAYRYSVETSVYVAVSTLGVGSGTQLYCALLAGLRDAGAHLAIGGIALPNPASVALHEKFGFRKVGAFQEVGFKFNEWIDVGYWQLVL